MDTYYHPIYRQAAALQHKFHDYTHTVAYDPSAMVIRKEIHNLTNDLATGKNPRTIENRLRTIQNQLNRTQILHPTAIAQGQQPILNYSQKNFLHSNFERMRQGIMQHPHY